MGAQSKKIKNAQRLRAYPYLRKMMILRHLQFLETHGFGISFICVSSKYGKSKRAEPISARKTLLRQGIRPFYNLAVASQHH
jgi:hypothetical protein